LKLGQFTSEEIESVSDVTKLVKKKFH